MADSTLPEKPVMSESNEERTLPESFKSPLPEETPEESKATVTAAPSEIGFSAGMDGLHETIQDDDFNDTDSALGSIYASSTKSITSSILKSREENGRTYHSYKDGRYVLPNDETELARMDLQNHMHLLTYDGKLHLCPLADKVIHRVLDVGTGTGIWAMDFADEHPELQVLGIDLSPNQPSFVPPNLHFEIDDIEAEWTFSHPFDFVHCRGMTGSIRNWPRFFEQAYAGTSPGGYIELMDAVLPFRCDDGSMGSESALRKWGETQVSAALSIGLDPTSALGYREMLHRAGWTDIHVIPHLWPMNHWPADPKYKELGQWMCANFMDGLNGFSMALRTRVLGWSKEEVELSLIDVRRELNDHRIHAYLPLYTFYARKPL